MTIQATEYGARQETARRLARQRGCTALLAWSRGGSTQDHYADVFYLTGFYTHQPFVPDEPGRWRAAGHTALVLPVGGPSTLFVDMARRQDPQPFADHIVVTDDLVDSVATALAKSVAPGEIALVGGETLVWRWARDLAARLPGHRFAEADDLLVGMRLIKTEAELDLLRKAGEVGTTAMIAAMTSAVPGATEADVAAAAISEIVRAGGAFYGMGLSSGEWAHTFSPSTPAAYSRTRLNTGDMIRLDLYGSFEGYLFDFGRSRVVGRVPTAEQQQLLDAVRDSVRGGIELLKPGQTLDAVARNCDASLAASAYARNNGIPHATMDGAWGHSIGLDWGAPWITCDSTVVVRPGMCFAIERRIEAPGIGGANYEDNVIVTEDGPEVVTPAPDRFDI
ncbi:MAG TPA: Xaa-Pro peptidase family protein [Thermomicrobiales bacterium]|nr:Xaa-Pro peptidase family protein [Thermomicrobiales bacterium]